MGTDRTNRKKPRNDAGRFALGNPGGPGRPKGSLNRTTIDARELRRRVIGSWERVSADEKLDSLAETDFPAYLRLVSPLIPKQDPPDSPESWRKCAETELMQFAEDSSRRALNKFLGFLSVMPPEFIVETVQGFYDEELDAEAGIEEILSDLDALAVAASC